MHVCMQGAFVLCFPRTGLDWTGLDFPAVIMNRLRSALTKREISTDV